MSRDILFLLRPDFHDGADGPFFCPDSAFIEGVLSFYPHLRTLLDVRYLEYPLSCNELVAKLGEGHQDCPLLVLADDDPTAQRANGLAFFDDTRSICRYLARRYRIGDVH